MNKAAFEKAALFIKRNLFPAITTSTIIQIIAVQPIIVNLSLVVTATVLLVFTIALVFLLVIRRRLHPLSNTVFSEVFADMPPWLHSKNGLGGK